MAAENKKNSRIKKSQRAVLEKMLEELEEKFLTREKIKSKFLDGRTSTSSDGIDMVSKLDLTDALRENLKTSLQFGDYRRAARYLVMLEIACEKFLA